jgi:transcriptional regulator of arginine metabolism
MQKSARHESILKIIGEQRISRQEQLVDLLNQQGFDVTQASVSRDLVGLEVVKSGGFYSALGSAADSVFGSIGLQTAGDHLIVARCQSGLASAVAVKIDAAGLNEIVGTLAGDDTIFIAVDSATAQRAAIKKLRNVFSR